MADFKSLAPSDEIRDAEQYNEWLAEIIGDGHYGNIALTGDLGVGKSSVIRTFERQKKYKFIYLSASDLGYRFDKKAQAQNQDEFQTADETEMNQKIQAELEKSLLVQLISLCSGSDIPKSRFRTVPENDDPRLSLAFAVACGIAAACIIKLIANNFIEKDFIPFFNFVPLLWICLALITGVIVGFGCERLLKHYRLSAFSIGHEKNISAKAEIQRNALEPETLDTDLHEILYIFEQLASIQSPERENEDIQAEKHQPVFIIEDLDRYPADICIPILTKLKQINNMLNNRYRTHHAGYGMQYQFIYLLNDRIFDSAESSRMISENDIYKFFDVIIPVLPKLGFTNSSDEIAGIFKNDHIDEELIQAVSNFAYDYRLLRDIENEFRVYQARYPELSLPKKQSENSDEDAKKTYSTDTVLLAFVIYKVFYKEKYYQFFKADSKTGVPQNELLLSLLMPQSEQFRSTERLEGILVHYFKDYLFEILQITEAMRTQDKAKIIVAYPEISWAGADLHGIDLNSQILAELDFSKADLSSAFLSRADLRRADLSGAHLRGAHLRDAVLGFADLREADLRNTDLWGIDLRKADLRNADLSDADLLGARLSDANLSGANLSNAVLFNANLVRASLDNAKLYGAHLLGANLSDVDLSNTDLSMTFLKEATYCRDPLRKTIFPEGFDPTAHGMIEVDKNGYIVSTPEPPKPEDDTK